MKKRRTQSFNDPIWVHQNIIKLSKEFGMEFEGCEKEAFQLFMQIDGKRRNTMESSSLTMEAATPKKKESKEVRNLDFGSKFKSNGTRRRGYMALDNK